MAPRQRTYPRHPQTLQEWKVASRREGGLSRAERFTSGGKPTRYRCRLCGLLVAGENALLESYQHTHEDNVWEDWINSGSVEASAAQAAARLRNLHNAQRGVGKAESTATVYSLDVAIQAFADEASDKAPDPANEVASEYRLIPQEFIGFTQHLLSRLRYTEGVLAKYRHASISDELGKAYDEYRGLGGGK
jgi:hypothetical protein